MFKRFLIAVLLFLIVVVVAADRVGAIVGAHVLATKLQSDESLANRPSTSIGGFPFLTQAIGGKYTNVSVTASDVLVNSVDVSTLKVHLHGVHLPPGKVFHGTVSRVPVDRVDGSAFVSYASANSYLRTHKPGGASITLSGGDGGQIRVSEHATVAGHAVSLSGAGSVKVTGNNEIMVSVTQFKGTTSVLGHKLSAAIPLDLHDIPVPLSGLPFRIKLTSVTASAAGVMAAGTASHIVLGSHND